MLHKFADSDIWQILVHLRPALTLCVQSYNEMFAKNQIPCFYRIWTVHKQHIINAHRGHHRMLTLSSIADIKTVLQSNIVGFTGWEVSINNTGIFHQLPLICGKLAKLPLLCFRTAVYKIGMVCIWNNFCYILHYFHKYVWAHKHVYVVSDSKITLQYHTCYFYGQWICTISNYKIISMIYYYVLYNCFSDQRLHDQGLLVTQLKWLFTNAAWLYIRITDMHN